MSGFFTLDAQGRAVRLRASLANGKGLTCCWSGRPHWYFHGMALGETIGETLLYTQNRPSLTTSSNQQVHIALMGDPTLRMHVVAPAGSPAAVQNGAAVANFVFERSQIAHAMDGIGAVIPAVEKRRLVAFSFSSVKFEGRAPEGKVVLRAFMGGALQPEISALPPEDLKRVALEELRDLVGIQGEPLFSQAGSHHGAMAQYHVGHLQRVAEARKLARLHRVRIQQGEDVARAKRREKQAAAWKRRRPSAKSRSLIREFRARTSSML